MGFSGAQRKGGVFVFWDGTGYAKKAPPPSGEREDGICRAASVKKVVELTAANAVHPQNHQKHFFCRSEDPRV